jgi:hypothetical protein
MGKYDWSIEQLLMLCLLPFGGYSDMRLESHVDPFYPL